MCSSIQAPETISDEIIYDPHPAWLTALILVSAIIMLPILTRPLKGHVPSDCTRVRSSVRSLLRLNFGKLAKEEGPRAAGWNERELWEMLCDSIQDQLGVSREEIVPDARFVKDLGVD